MSKINNVSVVGAGLMGAGIAQEFAANGFHVSLCDTSDIRLDDALKNILLNLRNITTQGPVTREEVVYVPNKIHTTTCLAEAVRDSDLVIEAVFEDLEVKRDLFSDLDRFAPKHAVLASNTSTLLPSQMASATNRADRVIVTHYFNPPYLIPLVEVVPGPQTSKETVQTISQLLTSIGKRPAILKMEAPGFVVNRLQVALLREALSIVEKGIASVEAVDMIVKNSFGRRLAAAGPFEIFDSAGWDVILAVISRLVDEIESSTEVPNSVKNMVGRGDLGMKSGRGFYTWTVDAAEAKRQEIGRYLAEIHRLSREDSSIG